MKHKFLRKNSLTQESEDVLKWNKLGTDCNSCEKTSFPITTPPCVWRGRKQCGVLKKLLFGANSSLCSASRYFWQSSLVLCSVMAGATRGEHTVLLEPRHNGVTQHRLTPLSMSHCTLDCELMFEHHPAFRNLSLLKKLSQTFGRSGSKFI